MTDLLHALLRLAVLILFALFVVAGLVWVVCWAFGYDWSMKLSIGVLAAMTLVRLTVVKKGKDDG